MKYLFSIILIFSFVGCMNSTPPVKQIPKPTVVVDANSSKELELMRLVVNNDINKTKQFLEDGINPNIKTKGYSAIELAVRQEHFEITKLLLEHGANPNEKTFKDNSDMSVVALASSLKKDNILRLLFKYGANPKKLNQYYTMVGAVVKNRGENLKFLLKNGFDINARSDTNETVLMFSAHKKETSNMTKILLENGADVNATNDKNSTALLMSINKNKNSVNIEYLLKYGADVNHKDTTGVNAVAFSIIKSKDITTIKQLINYGADIDRKILNLATPLLLALQLEKYNVAQVIAENLKEKPEGYLYIAMQYGKQRMFNFLLDNGFRIKKLKLSKERINMFLANNRDKELKEYFEIYGLDTFSLRYISKKAQKKIVKILNELYENNTLDNDKKNKIVKSLNNIGEYKRAYQWLSSIDKIDQSLSNRCFVGANVAKPDTQACLGYVGYLALDKRYAQLSWAYLLGKKYDDTIRTAKIALKKESTYYAYANLAHAYLLQGKKEKAYEAYKNYFFKTKNTNALHAIKGDFEMLKLNYPSKVSIINDVYKYCLELDYQTLRGYTK